MDLYYISAFFLYFVFLLSIGLWSHRKQTTSADFIMGNRSLSFWLVALSAHASDMSAWLFMGFPMAIFLLGLSQAWIAVGLIAGMYLNWQFVAPRLRSMTENYNCYTLSSFFEKRFQDTSGLIRSVSAIMLVLFMTHYLSAGMIGIGILLESVFGLNYYFGLTFALCIIVVYTFFGGFVTVAWTDLFQGIFLLLAVIIVPTLAFQKLDGLGEVFQVAQAKGINTSFLPHDFSSTMTMALLAISWGLGYFGMPHIITKFMGIKDVSEMHKSKWLGMSWQLVVLVAAISVGFIAIAFFAKGISDPQMVFVDMVKNLFHPLVAGFILCAILAAGMSTMDSQLLVCASVLSEDLYPAIRQEATCAGKLRISRLSIIGIAVVAMLLSINKSATIMDTVTYSWAGLGSAFGPLVLSALYSEKVNRYGAIAGMVMGGGMVMIWPHLNPVLFNYTLPAMIPGFFSSLGCIFFVSYLTKEKVASIQEELANPN